MISLIPSKKINFGYAYSNLMIVTVTLLLCLPSPSLSSINNLNIKLCNDISRLQGNRNMFSPSSATLCKTISLRGGGRGRAINAKIQIHTEQQSSKPTIMPIYKTERMKFCLMSIMMFLCIYIYTNVRDTKDTLIVTNCGAESIPFLKLYGVMPSATLFIILYSNLSNVLQKDVLFYCMICGFLCFYMIFSFVLYPFRDTIHQLKGDDDSVSNVKASALSLLRYWSFSLYYIVSELWSSIGVPIFFWQCANDITTIQQAKRFYPLFAVFGNFAPIASGKIMSYVLSKFPKNDTGFGGVLKILALVQMVAGLGICFIYHMLYSYYYNDDTNRKQSKVKKPTLSESLIELSKSKELASIATMVIGYNICIEITEVLWKAILKKTFHNQKSTYMNFLATISQIIGISAIVLQLVSSYIIQALGWKYTSLLTPICMGIVSIPFFISFYLSGDGTNLKIPLLLGTIQTIISKITKYSLFDPCKEMAYIPLDKESKTKGKATIDVLGSRFGRSIGNITQQLLVILLGGTILKCVLPLGIVYLVTILFWSRAVFILGKIFEDYNSNRDKNREKSGVV